MHLGKNNVMEELLPQISIVSLQNVRHFLKQPGKVQKNHTTVYSQLVEDIVHGVHQDLSHLPQIAWGVKHGKDANKAFMSDVASQHEGGLHGFKECGLFIKSGYPYLAAFPDGLFNCKCCGLATIEVKCPYSVRDDDILESRVYKRVSFLEEFDGQPRLRRTHKYFTQAQAQMSIM